MTGLSNYSWDRLDTCDERLQNIIEEVSQMYNIRVLEGRRSWARQAELLEQGRTKVGPGDSKHNPPTEGDEEWLSTAVDVVPYPIDWNDRKRFIYLAGMIKAVAHIHGVKLRWGGNWDMDETIIDDQNFDDLPHWEIV